MSYQKSMKHWKNHRKDRYYQQCSGGLYSSKEWAYCVIDSETKEILSNKYKSHTEAERAQYELQLKLPDRYTQIVDVCNDRPIIY